MPKKLLIQLDTHQPASTFDAVVAYDGGIDNLISREGVTPENCLSLIEGAIYTRAPKDKKNTALFIGGSDLNQGEALLDKVQEIFFSPFTVSVMLDSNGCNTTAAAAVALVDQAVSVENKTACVLAGTGPVGQRIAVMLAMAGAKVKLSSRTMERAEQACARIQKRFNVMVQPCTLEDDTARERVLADTDLVFATGKRGICLLAEEAWRNHPKIQALADVNTFPPAGIAGIDVMDKATARHGKVTFGGIGIGPLKLKLHRLCIEKLFEDNKQVLDAQAILRIARSIL